MLSVLDLMPEDKPGLVLSSGVDTYGNSCSLDSVDKIRNLSLLFDSSRADERSFQWQLTLAKQSNQIFRPLMEVSKQEIIEYAKNIIYLGGKTPQIMTQNI